MWEIILLCIFDIFVIIIGLVKVLKDSDFSSFLRAGDEGGGVPGAPQLRVALQPDLHDGRGTAAPALPPGQAGGGPVGPVRLELCRQPPPPHRGRGRAVRLYGEVPLGKSLQYVYWFWGESQLMLVEVQILKASDQLIAEIAAVTGLTG